MLILMRFLAVTSFLLIVACICAICIYLSYIFFFLIVISDNEEIKRIYIECIYRRAARLGGTSGRLASVANRPVTHPTRLVTRTKESNMCASHMARRSRNIYIVSAAVI